MKEVPIVFNNDSRQIIGKVRIEENIENAYVNNLRFELSSIIVIKRDKKELVGLSLNPMYLEKENG